MTDAELVKLEKPVEEQLRELRAEVDELKKAAKTTRVGPMDPEDWRVKGNHPEIRRRVYSILDAKVAIGYDDVRMDEWLPRETHIVDPLRWQREVRQFLLKDGTRHYPRREPGQGPLREFRVPRGNGRWYLARVSALHCAAEAACRRERISERRIGQVVRRLREELGATDEAECSVCGPVLRGEASTP